MLNADLRMKYHAPKLSALATLPSVFDMFRIFFAAPFSRNGRATYETNAGPIAFMHSTARIASGSRLSAASCTLCAGRDQPRS